MDHDFWLRFYSNWELEALVKEIGTCHLYQQDLLARACQRQIEMDQGLRLMITSQMREVIILQAIQEKISNGITENDRKNEGRTSKGTSAESIRGDQK